MKRFDTAMIMVLIVLCVAVLGFIITEDFFSGNSNITGNAYKSLKGPEQIVPNVACGDIIKSSIRINQDLVCPNSGLKIGNNKVVLDCQNHVISYASSGNGYGIEINNYDNVEIKNCRIETESKGIGDSGIYIKDSDDFKINNNTLIVNNGDGLKILNSGGDIYENDIIAFQGIYFMYGSGINIEENDIISAKENGAGIAGKMDSGGSVLQNKITTKMSYSRAVIIEGSDWIIKDNSVESNGTGISVMWGEKNTIKNNNIITQHPYHGGGYGLDLLELTNSVITGNTITTSGNDWAYGMKLWWVSDSLIEGNIVDSEESFAFFLWDSHDNTINSNEVLKAVEAVHMKPFDAHCNNNVISNNNFGDVSKYDLYLGRDGYGGSDNTQLINQEIRKYDIQSNIIVVENEEGKLEYLGPVRADGENLYEDIRITENSITVEKESLNARARLTFNELSIGSPIALMNGDVCPSDVCGPVAQQGDDYSYTVEHFTEYSIGEDSD